METVIQKAVASRLVLHPDSREQFARGANAEDVGCIIQSGCSPRVPNLMAYVLRLLQVTKQRWSAGFMFDPSVREHGLWREPLKEEHTRVIRAACTDRATKVTTSKTKSERSKRMRIISHQSRKSSQGFTLIEMIGVLAVIAILASMLVPKIFEAINSARINNTVQSYNAIKTAVMDHYGKYGSINYNGKTAAATTAPELAAYDRLVLLPEAMIDKPFLAKVGTNWVIQVVGGVPDTTAVLGTNPAYDLDGSGATVNDAAPATHVVEAVIQGVAIADALEISERLDGASLSNAAGSAAADLKGRVKYPAPAAAGDPVEVHIYIAHR